jgi:hypothetical protein
MQEVVAAVFLLVAKALDARVESVTIDGRARLAPAFGAAGFQAVAEYSIVAVDALGTARRNTFAALEHLSRQALVGIRLPG